MNTTGQRTLALFILLLVGFFSLPVAAYFLDGPGSENWIVPAQLLVMAIVGALVGRFLPGLAGTEPTTNRAMVFGAIVGLVAAMVGIVIFFLLLSGFSGA